MPEPPRNHFSEHAEDLAEDYALDDMPDAYIDLLDTFVDLVGEGTILDAGCGWGKDANYFVKHGLDAVGVDVADRMIAYARDHMDGKYRVMDTRNLDFADDTFTGIWCNTVMQFFPPDEMTQIVAELVRVLQPGGILYTTFKIGEGYVVTEDYGNEVKRYLVPEADAREMLEEQGLAILEVRRAELNDLTVLNVFCET